MLYMETLGPLREAFLKRNRERIEADSVGSEQKKGGLRLIGPGLKVGVHSRLEIDSIQICRKTCTGALVETRNLRLKYDLSSQDREWLEQTHLFPHWADFWRGWPQS